MDYQTVLGSAVAIIERHNANRATKLDAEAFKCSLANLGGTTVEALAGCTWEDLERCGLPRLIAREVAEVFRKANPAEPKPTKRIRARDLDIMTVPELVEAFDPGNPTSKVALKLKAIALGQPFIVFNEDGTLNVALTTQVVTELRQHYPACEHVAHDGKMLKIYALGHAPSVFVNENPIYHGRPLRPGDYCDQTSRSWEGVDKKVRQLVYLIPTDELSAPEIHRLIDMAVANNVTQIRQIWRGAAIQFDKLNRDNNLPRLLVELKPARPANETRKTSLSRPGFDINSIQRQLEEVEAMKKWTQPQPRPLADAIWRVEPDRERHSRMYVSQGNQSWNRVMLSTNAQFDASQGGWTYNSGPAFSSGE